MHLDTLPNYHLLLAFSLLLNGIHQVLGRPFWKGVAFSDFSAKIEGSKGGNVTSAEVAIERPVSRSDFSFQQDGLSGFDGGAVEE